MENIDKADKAQIIDKSQKIENKNTANNLDKDNK